MIKNIIIDMDGVLLNIDQLVEKRIQTQFDPSFEYSNMKSYDFNKSARTIDNNIFDMTNYIPLMNNYFHDELLYQNAPVEMDAINILQEYARQFESEIKFCIYTECYTPEIAMIKYNRFNILLDNMLRNKTIRFIASIDGKPAIANADAVIDDNPGNFKDYNFTTMCYLPDKDYNQAVYNPNQQTIFRRKNIIRCNSAANAIEQAVTHIRNNLPEA